MNTTKITPEDKALADSLMQDTIVREAVRNAMRAGKRNEIILINNIEDIAPREVREAFDQLIATVGARNSRERRMTSTPDTPNMTEAPRIREMHVKIMNQVVDEWFNIAIVSDFNADLIDEAMRVLRSIHEGSVVVVPTAEAKWVRDYLDSIKERVEREQHTTVCYDLSDRILRWLSHTDTTDATTQEAKC